MASTRLRHLRYTYAYDAAGRLASVDMRRHTGSMNCDTTTGGTAVLGTGSFTYEANTGNRNFTNSSYNGDDQLLNEGITGAVRSYTYDGRGRLIDRAGNLPMAFGWDTMGHLRSTTTAGATTSYRYDPAGRLIAIDNPGTDEDEYFVYRNGLEPVAWTRGEVHQYYVYASMPHVPDLIYEDSDADPEIDTIYRVITDERGSVRSVLRLGETIEVAQMVEYTAWGEPTYLHGDAHTQPFGFAGATWLPQARLWHMGARDYDPRLGRWISKDPIRFAGGTNLYVYCEGDPVNCIDPTGLDRLIGTIAGWVVAHAAGWVAGGLVGGAAAALTTSLAGRYSPDISPPSVRDAAIAGFAGGFVTTAAYDILTGGDIELRNGSRLRGINEPTAALLAGCAGGMTNEAVSQGLSGGPWDPARIVMSGVTSGVTALGFLGFIASRSDAVRQSWDALPSLGQAILLELASSGIQAAILASRDAGRR